MGVGNPGAAPPAQDVNVVNPPGQPVPVDVRNERNQPALVELVLRPNERIPVEVVPRPNETVPVEVRNQVAVRVVQMPPVQLPDPLPIQLPNPLPTQFSRPFVLEVAADHGAPAANHPFPIPQGYWLEIEHVQSLTVQTAAIFRMVASGVSVDFNFSPDMRLHGEQGSLVRTNGERTHLKISGRLERMP